MSTSVSDAVAKRLASLFGSEEDADCTVVFCIEADTSAAEPAQKQFVESTADVMADVERSRSEKEAPAASGAIKGQQHREAAANVVGQGDAEPAAKRQRVEGGVHADAASDGRHEPSALSDPLPAHQLILSSCSERFAAQASRSPSERLVLRVPLGCDAEVPSARAAIRFAYTGEVAAGSVREALEVRRQAAYLGIEGCAAACNERIIADLAQAQAEAAPEQQEKAAGANRASADDGPQLPCLQFFTCSALWPNAAHELGFAAVVAAAKKYLVGYFGDALAVLNTQPLFDEMLELPAVALEALLESDDFGTDSESSVLHLLAIWMQRNYSFTDAEMRQRLCRHVRLVQLSRAYLMSILPALAVQYDASVLLSSLAGLCTSPPDKAPAPTGWFPISVAEATFIASLATSSGLEREELEAVADGVYDVGSPWYSTQPRRQCLPGGGRTFSWHIDQKALEEALDEVVKPGDEAWVDAESDLGEWKYCSASGFLFEPGLKLKAMEDGTIEYSLALGCSMPGFIRDTIPEMKKYGIKYRVLAAPFIDTLVTIYRWQDGIREKEVVQMGTTATGRCWNEVLEKVRQPASPAAGGRPLDSLAAYLLNGKIIGAITLLPQSDEPEQ